MADTAGMADIRGLDIDKLAKGFAEESYVFKNECTVSKATADEIRWYQKTAGTLTATTPSTIGTTAPGATPEYLEQSWTRNTSYVKEFKAESFLSDRDIKTSDVDVLATTIRDITLAVVAKVDAHIWDVMSESQSPVNIQTFATTAVGGDQWDAASYAADIVADIMNAKRLIWSQNYNPEGATLFVNPKDYTSIVNWLISGKGSSIPGFSSEKVRSGTVLQLLGVNIKVSNNVTADYALMVVPKRATTFKQLTPTTAVTIDNPLLGKTVRVREEGVAYNTDPNAIVLITDTQT